MHRKCITLVAQDSTTVWGDFIKMYTAIRQVYMGKTITYSEFLLLFRCILHQFKLDCETLVFVLKHLTQMLHHSFYFIYDEKVCVVLINHTL